MSALACRALGHEYPGPVRALGGVELTLSEGELAVVIGPDHQAVTEEVRRVRPDAATFVQAERIGTAHAVLAARAALTRNSPQIR